MSHFFVVAILPKDTPPVEFDSVIEKLMAQYEEEREVPEYERECYCVGDEAHSRARKAKPDGDCQECGGTGKEKTTRNPLAKWDWYVIGGRWDGAIAGNVCRAGELPDHGEDWAPFAVVTPDGSWHERAKMGWFGATHGSRTHADWEIEARGICAQYADHTAVGLDCHI